MTKFAAFPKDLQSCDSIYLMSIVRLSHFSKYCNKSSKTTQTFCVCVCVCVLSSNGTSCHTTIKAILLPIFYQIMGIKCCVLLVTPECCRRSSTFKFHSKTWDILRQ